MSYRLDNENQSGNKSIVIDGWEKGIASSPYTGIGNIRNLATAWYPSVAYVNYKRQSATLSDGHFFAGIHSINVSNNFGWQFTPPSTITMGNPVAKVTSPAGLNYVLDSNGNVFKQNSVNSSTFSIIENGGGRVGMGGGGLAYWNNYLIVFGNGLIEFNGNGTGDSGITSANWNVLSTNTTVQVTSAYVTMSTGGVPSSPVNFNFTVAPNSGATSATLNALWTGPTGVYSVKFPNANNDVRSVTLTNNQTSATWSVALTANCAATNFDMFQLAAVDFTYYGYSNFIVGSSVTFSSTGTLPGGLTAGTTYYLQETVDITGLSSSFYVSTQTGTNFANAIFLTSTGSGTITMTLTPSTVPPISNTTITNIAWSTPGTGSTTITLSSNWEGQSGTYNIVDPSGNNMQAIFTYNSITVTLLNPATFQAPVSSTFLVQILNPNVSTYKTWNSKVDGNLYWANGRWVGQIALSPNANIAFNPGIPASYTVNYAATGTLQDQDNVVDMTDLQGKMIILGNQDAYPWDYVSSQPSASFPIGEQTTGIVNILNNLYIFAGQKGNIYVSNGYSAQVLYKLSDYIAGVIDPIWSWGGYMFHRGKLYFQATASNTSGTNILAGIFSMNVSATLVTDVETANALIMESQNSYGLTPASGASTVGLLMDNEPSSNGQDSYYSAWSNGSNIGGIDYNSTTLWQNNEPVIETDIIPIGTILSKQSFGRIEYKLDRPLALNDSITMYWRPSLTDSYVQIGTGTTATANYLPLSADFPSNITQAQWAQFKITFSCASSGSSFIPLREVRLHYGNQ